MQVFQVLRLRHQVREDGAHARLKLVRLRKIVQVRGQIELGLVVDATVGPLVVLDPAVIEHLLDRGASAGVLVEGTLDEADGILGHISQQVVVRLILRNIIIHTLLGWILRMSAIIERRSASQENISDDSCSPAIDLIIVRLLFDQLGSHVHGASKGKSLLVIWVVFRRESKICQLDVDLVIVHIIGVLLAQKILRLQISMHDVLLVHEVEGEEDLLDNVRRLRLCEPVHGSDLVQ